MNEGRSFRFTQFLSRRPAMSVVGGLRDGEVTDPDAALFAEQHAAYVATLESIGGRVTLLPALEEFPDPALSKTRPSVQATLPLFCGRGRPVGSVRRRRFVRRCWRFSAM